MVPEGPLSNPELTQELFAIRATFSVVNSVNKAINKLMFKESFPNGLTLLLGSSGTGKTIFSQQYACEELQRNTKVLWITTEELPSTIRTNMSGFGWDVHRYEREGQFQIIDAVSPARLGLSEKSHGVLGLDPTGMLIFLSEKLRRTEDTNGSGMLLIVIDSISRLLLSCDTKSVIDFVSCLNSRLENFATRGIATVSDGAHDDRILSALTFSSVGTFKFRISESQGERTRQFRIETLRGRRHDDRWKNYKITKIGLDIEA